MLAESDASWWGSTEHGTHILFVPDHPKPKTKVWHVESTDGDWLGNIEWFAPWRKYCFCPRASTVFEQVCLREIAAFCERKTEAHKTARAR